LTVSPFITLPAATTLSYNYKTMPSTLPPSSTGIASTANSDGEISKPKYVVSPSGHAAHPDDIIASCRALQAHVNKLQDDAERELRELEERIRARELAEKRRVAPGWLDSEARLLEPERRETPMQGHGTGRGQEMDEVGQSQGNGMAGAMGGGPGGVMGMTDHFDGMSVSGPSEMATDQGAELDRAFGRLHFQ
jgi:hypothetical protein